MFDDLQHHQSRSALTSARWVVWLSLLFVVAFLGGRLALKSIRLVERRAL